MAFVNPVRSGKFGDGDIVFASSSAKPGTLKSEVKSKRFNTYSALTVDACEGTPAPRFDRRIVYVNGIQTDPMTHCLTLKWITNLTGAGTMGVYNASNNISSEPNSERTWGEYLSWGWGSFVYDLGQCALDKISAGNPADITLTRLILEACQYRTPLNIVAHSQGCLITSNAVGTAIRVLKSVLKSPAAGRLLWPDLQRQIDRHEEARGKTILYYPQQAQLDSLKNLVLKNIEARLQDMVSIQTFGGAARRYPNGPWYHHTVNAHDPVPMNLGLGQPGKNWEYEDNENKNWLPSTAPGRGSSRTNIDRDVGGTTDNHSITNLYLTKHKDSGYDEPIKLRMLRGTLNG